MKDFLVLFIFTVNLLFPSLIQAQEKVKLAGTIYDAESEAPLAFATVRIGLRNIGTLSNEQGKFALTLPKPTAEDSLTISYLGYISQVLALKELIGEDQLQIRLQAIQVELEEILINPMDTWDTVRKAVRKVPDNYNYQPVRLEGFYRETMKGEMPHLMAEGVIEIYKAPVYSKREDEVYVMKGRRKELPYFIVKDSVRYDLPEIQEGPMVGVFLDIVRHDDAFLDKSSLRHFSFKLETIDMYEGQVWYVITFEPRNEKDAYAYFKGKLYLERETLTVTKAEYKLSKAGLRLVNENYRQLEVMGRDYEVDYQQYEGKWYLQSARVRNHYRHKVTDTYLQSDIRLLITETDLGRTKPLKGQEQVRVNNSILEVLGDFDSDFWEDYNILLPDK